MRLNDRFVDMADKVSFGIGTPTNIVAWILMVVVWFALGVALPSLWTTGSFLPAWFTSTAWNFPLNTITTLAELYIGFLVAAAANRAERNIRRLLTAGDKRTQHIEALADQVERLEEEHGSMLADIHRLITEMHASNNQDGMRAEVT